LVSITHYRCGCEIIRLNNAEADRVLKLRLSEKPSPGIIMTPLARDELTGPRGEGYRHMIEVSAAGRTGTPDEVGTVGALLMGPDGGFITGSDILMDGGVTAAYWYGELAPQ
jgi:Enoyl-(Acyl carrier protein) reductase